MNNITRHDIRFPRHASDEMAESSRVQTSGIHALFQGAVGAHLLLIAKVQSIDDFLLELAEIGSSGVTALVVISIL